MTVLIALLVIGQLHFAPMCFAASCIAQMRSHCARAGEMGMPCGSGHSVCHRVTAPGPISSPGKSAMHPMWHASAAMPFPPADRDHTRPLLNPRPPPQPPPLGLLPGQHLYLATLRLRV